MKTATKKGLQQVMNSKFAFSVLFAFVLPPLGSCLLCYHCSTEEPGDACKHPQETTVTVVHCLGDRVCYSRFLAFSRSRITFERGCGPLWDCVRVQNTKTERCVACTDDLCNTWYSNSTRKIA